MLYWENHSVPVFRNRSRNPPQLTFSTQTMRSGGSPESDAALCNRPFRLSLLPGRHPLDTQYFFVCLFIRYAFSTANYGCGGALKTGFVTAPRGPAGPREEVNSLGTETRPDCYPVFVVADGVNG